MKERLDKFLLEKELFASREKARAYIIGGHITVNGETVIKPSALVSRDSDIRIHLPNEGYVSRGGLKLKEALVDFRIDVSGVYCLDIGASTGGFTDCLLKKGAEHVIALDVGKNQIDYRLRIDPRVKVIEKFNARFIDQLETEIPFGIVTIDVSFISIKKILKPLIQLIDEAAQIIVLIKPQFELDRPYKGFRGVVNDRDIHKQILQDLNSFFYQAGYTIKGYTFSQIKGPKGNIEYFVCLGKKDRKIESEKYIYNFENLVRRSWDYFH
jgi:23S rRNA (cytidine1920-2'-O)/16S rRNA (cytidine1409-2'-O)-methyltransferase